MAEAGKKRISSDFRRFFLRGLATLLPTVLTIVLLVKCFEFIQNNISVYLMEGVIRAAVLATGEYTTPSEDDITEYIKSNKAGEDAKNAQVRALTLKEEKRDIQLWNLRQKWTHGPRSLVGFVLAISLVYIVGRLLASYVGRKLWHYFEGTVQEVPGFKQIYPYVKQVTDYLFGENRIQFNRVVAVPYPREGIWSVGLVTGAGLRHLNDKLHEEFLTIFIPSSPTPVTGYVIHVKKEDAIDLPISFEEAIRFIVSGGVIVPGHQALPTQRIELSPGPIIDQQKTPPAIKQERS